MKNIFFAISVFALSISTIAKPLSGDVHVNVKGMVCGFCVQGLTKTFQKQNEVETVHVSLEEKSVHLKIKKDQSMDSDKIINLIKEAGYEGQIAE